VSDIRFLKRKEIDEQKWDEVISHSFNSLPYAFSWYLDAVAENWDALVLNNYEAVMPLVWLRKLGVKCLYQPYYCQQLGVFSIHPVNDAILRGFLQTASGQFSYIHINLNPSVSVVANEFSLIKKKNLLLALNLDYVSIQKKYSESHRRNIAKAQKAGLSFAESGDLKAFQKFYPGNINHAKENFKVKHEKIFRRLSQLLISNKQANIFTVCDAEGNLSAAALVIFHKTRLISIINTSSLKGKKTGASHFLFDQIIKKFSNSAFTLDFEGSSIVTIARFYEGFGATEEVFYNYKNTLLTTISQRFR
jgi:hypothetical protein